MTDREKILRGAECCKGEPSANGCPKECPYLPKRHLTCGLDPFLDDVIALLKEQEPVEPKKDDAWPYPISVCGACGTCLFKVGDYKPNYCSECGRPVKWDD